MGDEEEVEATVPTPTYDYYGQGELDQGSREENIEEEDDDDEEEEEEKAEETSTIFMLSPMSSLQEETKESMVELANNTPAFDWDWEEKVPSGEGEEDVAGIIENGVDQNVD